MDNQNINIDKQQNNQVPSSKRVSSITQPAVNGQQTPMQTPTSNQSINEVKKKNRYLTLATKLWMRLNPALRKIILITGFIFSLLLLIAIVFSLSTKTGDKVKSIQKSDTVVEKSPLPEITINASRYATDSAVLAVEESLKTIEKEIGSTVINDLKLTPPNLLWDINFED